jgi:hypothetical protein
MKTNVFELHWFRAARLNIWLQAAEVSQQQSNNGDQMVYLIFHYSRNSNYRRSARKL